MSPEELRELNRSLSKRITRRGASLRNYKGLHGKKIGQKSYGYREAVSKGWIRPKTKAELRIRPKKSRRSFARLDRLEQVKQIREKIRWLRDSLNSRSGIRHAISTLGTADPGSMPYRLYDMMNELYPSISYVVSKKPRKRFNSEYWLDMMFEIAETSASVDEMIDRMKEVAENAYEEQNREDEEADSFLFGDRPK